MNYIFGNTYPSVGTWQLILSFIVGRVLLLANVQSYSQIEIFFCAFINSARESFNKVKIIILCITKFCP